MPGSQRPKEYDAVVIVRISETLRERVAQAAWVRHMSLSEATRDALERWLTDMVPDEPRT